MCSPSGSRCARCPPRGWPRYERAAREYLGDEVEAIGRDELIARMARGDVVLVDVRPAEEFEAGHIDGAQSIPLEELKRRLDELPGDREVVAYCRGPFCAYAHEAVRALRAEGRSARRLEEGWPEWRLSKRGDPSMTTETRQLDTTELEQRVKRMYEEVALEPEREFHFETGRPLAERLGYPADDLDRIPAAAIDSFAGVGYFLDLAAIQPGEAVLDLGSGSGTDSFLAALAGGPNGRVIGIDMTEEQLDKARRLAVEGGFGNVDFRVGYIERPPVEPEGFDCVISNGVINLSPDKPAVFAAAARALRPGGRLALADIVTETQLPEGVTCDASLWAACIGGAMQRDGYRAAIEAAGFEIEAWRENPEYRFVSERADNATQKYGVTSISLLARRT